MNDKTQDQPTTQGNHIENYTNVDHDHDHDHNDSYDHKSNGQYCSNLSTTDHASTDQLQTTDQDITRQNASISIFDQPSFPQVTKPVSFTPQQLLSFFDDYATTTKTLAELEAKYGIDHKSMYDLATRYDEIYQCYRHAQKAKSQLMADAAAKDLESLPDTPEIYQTDRVSGQRVLTSAGARLLEAKSNFKRWRAVALETGTFVPRQQVESKSINVTANYTGQLFGEFDPSEMDPSKLINAIRANRG